MFLCCRHVGVKLKTQTYILVNFSNAFLQLFCYFLVPHCYIQSKRILKVINKIQVGLQVPDAPMTLGQFSIDGTEFVSN